MSDNILSINQQILNEASTSAGRSGGPNWSDMFRSQHEYLKMKNERYSQLFSQLVQGIKDNEVIDPLAPGVFCAPELFELTAIFKKLEPQKRSENMTAERVVHPLCWKPDTPEAGG